MRCIGDSQLLRVPVVLSYRPLLIGKRTAQHDSTNGSHTVPTPQEYTMQQLGLTLTRAYGMHLRKATQHMGTKPVKRTVVVVVEPPPGFESIGATNRIVVYQRAACALS